MELNSPNLTKSDNTGRAFVVYEDGTMHSWDEYAISTGNGMKMNMFPKHEMSLVMPKKTIDKMRDQLSDQHIYHSQRFSSSHDSFNIRSFLTPGMRKSFADEPHRKRQENIDKFYNYRCFDIKKWK
jgi:hypothetical protein